MASSMLVLPGDDVPPSIVPQNSKKALVLGPGLRPAPPSSVAATIAGALSVDARKNAIWVEHNGGRVFLICRKAIDPFPDKEAVHPTPQRPRHRDRPPLLHRRLQLHHNSPRPAGVPPTARLRRCHPKDTSKARSGRARLRAHCRRTARHGGRTLLRISDER